MIQQTQDIEKCIENIDVGGPSMIRAAAKNYNSTAIVIDKKDYNEIVKELIEYGGISTLVKKKLAYKAFERTMHYDCKISSWMSKTAIK